MHAAVAHRGILPACPSFNGFGAENATTALPEGQKDEMFMTLPIALAVPISLRTMDAPRLSCSLHRLRHTLQAVRHVLIACTITILSGGCASNYGPKPDLSSVETIGVYLPEESSEPLEAEEVLQLYNRTEGEDTAKNVFAGAGAGAFVGVVAGAAAGAATCGMAGCDSYIVPFVALGSGIAFAIIGTAAGAVTGANVDTREQVEMAPVHRYEVNKVLPSLQGDYLTRSLLEGRVLRLLRQQNPTINFAPAVQDAGRYSLQNPLQPGEPYTDVNLVLSELRVLLAGKEEDDPRVRLTVRTQWELTKYDASSNSNLAWDILSGSYRSEKYPLSIWLADEGALLKTHVNYGMEQSLSGAFAELGGNAGKEDWPVLSTGDSF